MTHTTVNVHVYENVPIKVESLYASAEVEGRMKDTTLVRIGDIQHETTIFFTQEADLRRFHNLLGDRLMQLAQARLSAALPVREEAA
jgi:hypothetical protein